jgi:predicted RNA-binding protein with PIN domain
VVEWLIIDGFSLLHRDEAILAAHRAGRLMPARQRLVARVEPVAGSLARRTTVVFDGRGEGGPGEEFAASAIEVLFSPSGLTADSVIERLVRTASAPAGVLVVTSDRRERENVGAAGAQSMGCGDFLEWLAREERGLAARIARRGRAAPRHTLGDHLGPPSG